MVIVDALLGTGFEGEPRGSVAEAIDAVNAAKVPVVSVDVPSGVDASTGVVCGRAVRAAATVTFHAAKPGCGSIRARAMRATVETIDIGIPRGAPDDRGRRWGLGRGRRCSIALPRRAGAVSTKFTSGHVLVVGGSRGLTGAPRMTAHASMRAGAGYVTACVPASLQGILASGGPPEMMTRGLADDEGGLSRRGRGGACWRATERGGALARWGQGWDAATGRSRSRARSRARRRSRWCSTPTA